MKKTVVGMLFWLSFFAYGDARTQWKQFTANSKTITAEFSQSVITPYKTETAQGTLAIARPNKFRWIYREPYQQMIIGNGQTLWVYDVELLQATKKSMKEVMGSAYTLMLAGTHRIERDYRLTNADSKEGLEWLHAVAKSRNRLFRTIDMGFRDNTLVKMTLVDTYGQRIQLVFTHMKKNVPISPDHFIFTKPNGVTIFPGL